MKNKTSIFRFEIGLIIAMAFVLASFEWKTYSDPNVIDCDFEDDMVFIEDHVIPLTYRKQEAPKPIPKKENVTINIVTFVDPAATKPTVVTTDPMLIEVPFFEPEPIVDNAPLYTAEVPPEYPGGFSEMYKYLYTEINYSARCREAGVEGTIHAQFVVGKNGNIRDVKILRGLDYCKELEKEVMRVIKNMPLWNPGKQNGRNVNVYYSIPIRFTLRK